MEGDEALFSLGMVEETWNMLVNVWGWRRVLLFNLTCEVLLIFGGSGFQHHKYTPLQPPPPGPTYPQPTPPILKGLPSY